MLSGTHNKLQHGNNFKHWKFSDLVVDLHYLSFSHPNPTHFTKHEFQSPNIQIYQCTCYVEYYSVHV